MENTSYEMAYMLSKLSKMTYVHRKVLKKYIKPNSDNLNYELKTIFLSLKKYSDSSFLQNGYITFIMKII